MSNADFVTGFIDAWNALNVDSIMEHFTDDCVYINMPMDPPNNGKEEIRAFIEGFTGSCTEINFTVHHQTESADGRIVMNERTDRLKMNGKWVELAVMGVFEFRDGKICAWRDYFDMAALTAQ
ncbi:MAG: limonene-1,2-epoxide hydrolase family protein [Pseudomonadales bacterium]